MKRLAITTALIVMAAGLSTAHAAPSKNHGFFGKSHVAAKSSKHRSHGVNRYKQKQIAISRSRLTKLKRRVRADGRVTFFERRLVRAAEARLRALVSKKTYR